MSVCVGGALGTCSPHEIQAKLISQKDFGKNGAFFLGNTGLPQANMVQSPFLSHINALLCERVSGAVKFHEEIRCNVLSFFEPGCSYYKLFILLQPEHTLLDKGCTTY